jgi:beta-N-acetylhexosaminidase
MDIKKILLLILSLFLLIGAIGCNNDTKDSLGIRGDITQIILGDDESVTGILVEGKVESDTVYDKARVGIAKDTVILKTTGQEISPEDLKEGMKVEVVFQGAVAESYPVQGQAKAIRVVE